MKSYNAVNVDEAMRGELRLFLGAVRAVSEGHDAILHDPDAVPMVAWELRQEIVAGAFVAEWPRVPPASRALVERLIAAAHAMPLAAYAGNSPEELNHPAWTPVREAAGALLMEWPGQSLEDNPTRAREVPSSDSIIFDRIHEDEIGAWPLDYYMDYIERVADLFPAELRAFATAIESYQLQGKRSMHDSRMTSFSVSKRREGLGVGNDTKVQVTFLDQMFEGEFVLTYEGVSAFRVLESGLRSRQASDVLLHEVSVRGSGQFRHSVLFDGGGGYVVDFSEFSREFLGDA